jgi:cobyrinic acid a,c-diamide synthase
MALVRLPRMVIGGLAGDAGKTLVSLGLIRALRRRGKRVAAFKKGPDFIDAAWLGTAAGRPGRNLDTFIMPGQAILDSLARQAGETDIAVVEGNRGLFDGVDARGTHSTAELAKHIGAPVVLVVDATKVTGTVAALVLGCRALDPELPLAGVILNRLGTARHEKVIREALAPLGIPVFGALPRLEDLQLPSRHLGLVTVAEQPAAEAILEKLGEVIERHVDIGAMVSTAAESAPLAAAGQGHAAPEEPAGVRIGVLRDASLTFYYPENLEALSEAGAELVAVSPLSDGALPAIDALYAGGGFPEVYAGELSANREFRDAIGRRIAEGLPVWAECGGLMYLSRELVVDGTSYPMAGVLPLGVTFTPRPQGHGYVVARVDRANPFVPEGACLRGHEFHYSQIVGETTDLPTALALERGTGLGARRDGVLHGNVLASYTHFHALGTPEWAPGLIRAAQRGGW